MDRIFEHAARRYAHRVARAGKRRRLKAAGAAVAFVAAASLFVASSYAINVSADDATNTLSIAGNSIEIVEAFPDEPPVIEQGSIEKVVTVANTGTAACFVRARIELSDSAAESYASFSVDMTSWTEKQPDEWYYYRSALPVGSATSPLISSVDIGEAPASGYEDFDVIVQAESAQAKDPSTGSFYPDAQSAFAALDLDLGA